MTMEDPSTLDMLPTLDPRRPSTIYPRSWRLREIVQRERYYRELGRNHAGIHPRDRLWSKLQRWKRLVSNAALGIDDCGRKSRFFKEPQTNRLASLREHLLERREGEQEVEEVEELILWLYRHVGERESPFGGLLKDIAGDVLLPPCIQDQRIPENLRWPINPAWRDWVRALSYFPDNIFRDKEPPGRLLDSWEVYRLFGACLAEGDATGFRDAAMFATLYCTAASSIELTSLNLCNWLSQPPCLHLSASVFMGQGGREAYCAERVVPLTPDMADLLAGWVALRGCRPGDLFVKIDAYGTVLDCGVGFGTLHTALRKRSLQAGLEQIHPEDLRRTGLSDLFRQGASLLTVANVAGHGSLGMSERYRPERWTS